MDPSTTVDAPKQSSGVGHNKPPLTEDEAAALTTYYELKIREDQRKVDALKADLGRAREVVNGHFKRMTADLGFTRKEFEAEVIDKANMSEAEYLAAERKRARLHRLAGRNPGEQLDLLNDAMPDTVDDEIIAEADGYRAGRRADDPVPPSNIAPIMHIAWMRGWHKGQEENGLRLARAAEIIARPKPGQMAAAPEEPGEPEEDDGDPEVIKRKARKLKDSGWMEPTAEEQSFEAAGEDQVAA